jgi:chlorobactene glucosyltransferase
MSLLSILLLLFAIYFTVITLLTLFNLITVRRFKYSATENDNEIDDVPLVSVLIPARNEEQTLPKLLNSLSFQSYNNLEVLVLNDNSTDGTQKAVFEFIDKNPDLEVTLLEGKELPNGWTGKSHACHQLSESAVGDLLLFIDADVILEPYAIETAVGELVENNLRFLTIFPTQKYTDWKLNLIIPTYIYWWILTKVPLRLNELLRFRAFSIANGQFLLFEKDTYKDIGGHITVKKSLLDDVELARNVTKAGYKYSVYFDKDLVSCVMYSSLGEAIQGFSKNFFAVCFNNLIIFLGVIFVALINILPYFLILFDYRVLYILVLILFQKLFLSIFNRTNPVIQSILHPFEMTLFIFIGFKSLYRSYIGSHEWKGRSI